MKFEVQVHDELDSTSVEAKRQISRGKLAQPTAIVARQQTSGRGSRGRSWISPLGNIYVTYVFEFKHDPSTLPLAVYPISLAVRDTVEEFVPSKSVKIKWPNDVLLEERKVSGALHETANFSGKVVFIAGIGINVESPPSGDLNYKACCMQQYSSDTLTAQLVLQRLTELLTERIKSWEPSQINDTLSEYMRHAFRLGEQIEVSTRGDRSDSIRGIFRGIEPDGRLILDIGDHVTKLSTGSIFPDLQLG